MVPTLRPTTFRSHHVSHGNYKRLVLDYAGRGTKFLGGSMDWSSTDTTNPKWMRFLDWIEAHTPGGSWPWGQIWIGHGVLRGCSFHFATGYPSGFAFGFPLPRWLPGFVRSYQTDGPRRFWQLEKCWWWRGSDLHAIVPFFPPGIPSALRTRRLRKL